jgi:hypothetical protein
MGDDTWGMKDEAVRRSSLIAHLCSLISHRSSLCGTQETSARSPVHPQAGAHEWMWRPGGGSMERGRTMERGGTTEHGRMGPGPVRLHTARPRSTW